MRKKNWIRKPFIVGTLSLMLVNTSIPINVKANEGFSKEVKVLKVGDEHEYIVVLKEYLDLLGYALIEGEEETNVFTDELEKQIKLFQEDNELDVSGEVDEEVLALVESLVLDLETADEEIKTIEEISGQEESENEVTEKQNAINENEQVKEEVDSELSKEETVTEQKVTTYSIQATPRVAEPSVFKNGMRHKKVQELKSNLKKLGFTVPGNGTTLYGAQTEAKVKEFQSYYGLTADGQAGPSTFNKIDSILNTPLQNGKRHKDTQKLKADLKTLGFSVPGKGTTLYGKETEAKVRAFQQKYNLVVNGIADEVTLKKIAELVKAKEEISVLENGVRHAKVKTLKANLKKLGFTVPGNGTTLYGKQTETKVKEFQRYYGLAVTGKVDQVTDNKINSILKTPLQNGKRHKDTQKLKADLKTLGFAVPGKGTTLYGKETEIKVRAFQQKYNLVVNGIADEVTLKKIAELVKAKEEISVLENGVRHAKVKTLKANLKKLGFTVPGNGTTLYGKQTEAKVKEFQRYYGLSVTGKVDQVTDNKINSILKTPLQNGKRHKDTQKLKKDLALIGYIVPGNGTTLYGLQTEKVVKQFQKDKGLVVNGIADEVTLQKIAELVKKESQKPNEKTEYTDYGVTLKQAVNLQLKDSAPQTDKYRNEDAYVSKDYITLAGKGVITGGNVNIRTNPKRGATVAYKLKRGSSINVIKSVKGGFFEDTDIWYQVSNNGELYYVHSNYADVNEGNASAGVNVRAASNTSSHIYGALKKGEKVSILEQLSHWYKIDYKIWRNPTKTDLEQAMNPNNGDKFQHLRLDTLAGATATQLNKTLQTGGVLEGQGQAFINGAKKAKINEAYLVAHAMLETGNGTSKLANGIEVGVNSSGKATVVTKDNRKTLKNIKKVYNMFGIGAVDSNADIGGAIRAYQEGWTTPGRAVEGGAQWVGQQYIYNAYKQNTIYKMRWNPQMAGGAAWKQYATDIGWANKQVTRIKQIYNNIDKPNLHFDVPRYK